LDRIVLSNNDKEDDILECNRDGWIYRDTKIFNNQKIYSWTEDQISDKHRGILKMMHTKSNVVDLIFFSRIFCRFCSILCRLSSFSDSESINSFFIPTRKHFARRQYLHITRNLRDVLQSPLFGQIKPSL